MAIIKKYFKKNRKINAYYQAQLYFKGTRLKCGNFKNKKVALAWYKKEKAKFLKNYSFFHSNRSALFFSSCVNRYKQEALPLLQISTQQSYAFHFKYFTEGPLSKMKIKNIDAMSIHTWINWLKRHPTANYNGRKTFINELKALSIILNWYRNFVDEGFNNPITKKHRQLCYYKIVPPKRPDYYARPEELKQWIQWLKDNRQNPV